MSEFNFDKLKNIDIPTTWVDKALDVSPKTDKPPVVFLNFKRFATAVACLLVVCFVALIPFLFKNSNNLLSVEPTDKNNGSATDTSWVQGENDDKQQSATSNETINQTTATEQKPTQSETKPSKPDPTEDSNQSSGQTSTPSGVPSDKPTQAPTEEPTDSPTGSGGYGNYDGPSIEGMLLEGFVSAGKMAGSSKIYCAIYDSKTGLPAFSDNLYSYKYEAYFWDHPTNESEESKLYVMYELGKSNLPLKQGTYNYYFVNENNVQLYSGSFVV